MRHRLVAASSSLLLLLSGLALLGLATAPAASAATTIIPVPTSAAGLGRIVAHPDGSLWFTEEDANKVGRLSPAGTIQEFPFAADFPGTTTVTDIDIAPDGSVWVLYQQGRWVAKLDAAGNVLISGQTGDYADRLRVAPDGTVWVTVAGGDNYVLRIVGNQISELPNSPECEASLGEAADGSMWCRTSSGLTKLGAAGGGVTYPANNFAAYPYAIAAGPVGSIWFGRYFSGTFITSPDDGEVGYLDAASGAVTAYNTGSRTAPNSLVQGPDGNMWFTSIGAAAGIGHISPNGKKGALTAIGGYEPNSLAFGTDGAVYATDSENNVIIRTTTDQLQVTNVDPGEGSVLTGGGALPTVKAGKKPITVKQGAVPLKVACPKDAGATCVGKAKLTTNAKKKPQAISKSVKFKVKPGKNKQLRLELTGKGLTKLKKGKATKVRVELYLKGSKEPVVVKVVKVKR